METSPDKQKVENLGLAIVEAITSRSVQKYMDLYASEDESAQYEQFLNDPWRPEYQEIKEQCRNGFEAFLHTMDQYNVDLASIVVKDISVEFFDCKSLSISTWISIAFVCGDLMVVAEFGEAIYFSGGRLCVLGDLVDEYIYDFTGDPPSEYSVNLYPYEEPSMKEESINIGNAVYHGERRSIDLLSLDRSRYGGDAWFEEFKQSDQAWVYDSLVIDGDLILDMEDRYAACVAILVDKDLTVNGDIVSHDGKDEKYLFVRGKTRARRIMLNNLKINLDDIEAE